MKMILILIAAILISISLLLAAVVFTISSTINKWDRIEFNNFGYSTAGLQIIFLLEKTSQA
ncbi:hypothetical protein B738_23793 [Photorhabdus temperata subsp. temperata M1021]|nr:hypothetical protein B738_23793 [Photorhabdus temperata subsp. temperata M1021]